MRKYKLCEICKRKENYSCQDVEIKGQKVCACCHILEKEGIETISQKLQKIKR